VSEDAEIGAVLAQQGQGGSRNGQPTHFKSPFKGPLSASSRAVAQRDCKATFTAEEEALVAAGHADRSAKSNLMKKIRKVEKDGDVVYVKAETEKLEEKRYKDQPLNRINNEKSFQRNTLTCHAPVAKYHSLWTLDCRCSTSAVPFCNNV
jgi:hypothetical protein